ncbi:possible transposase [Asticcacaulis excentricus]|uniref:Possible transposase n=1 Tax=Asticcacaulis excentricus TaxID=78587 RepID=A0A3G9G5G6_9CAUL|nr:possible transposase [Asticcacaulis excentricus]
MKPANEKENRRDRRKTANQSGKRQVVVIMPERDGRTMPLVNKSEAQGVALVAANVDQGATVHADEASHWDNLSARFMTKRINHS